MIEIPKENITFNKYYIRYVGHEFLKTKLPNNYFVKMGISLPDHEGYYHFVSETGFRNFIAHIDKEVTVFETDFKGIILNIDGIDQSYLLGD